MNKVAVISGASKGIGLAIANKFASEGIDLIITSRNQEDLNKIKIDLEAAHNISVHVFVSDISQKEGVQAFSNFINSLNRPIDILVNNAGTFLQGNLLDEPEGALETQIDTNLYSAYHLTRGVISSVRKAPQAHIFNICSIASLQAYSGSGSYTISKFALLGFSKSLRAELLPEKIKVTAVLPGATFTSSWEGVDLPESRFISATDVADSIWSAYSLSPSAVVEEIVIRPTEGDI
ncbi:SDR family NAD(P)-dependent oxidoreductase [uncultured Arcticibacterium sp.]|uniref:SDR family oxidoreductase n=1 Tax=uncultured Arcticibacterium sp. TaxID=2173042 RepID=UPI0030F50DB9